MLFSVVPGRRRLAEHGEPGKAAPDLILGGLQPARTRQSDYCTRTVQFPERQEASCYVYCYVSGRVEPGFNLPSTWIAQENREKTRWFSPAFQETYPVSF
jgi:hypothetical protein